MNTNDEELEKLADVFECIAMTLHEILGASIYRALNPGNPPDTTNLREGARNVAYKLDAWDKVDIQ